MWRSLLVLLVACGSSPRGGAGAPTSERSPAVVLSPDVALARIESTYRAGVQRCYQSWLKRDPSASGTVVVTFTVGERGKLTSASAKGVHRNVEQCVQSAMMKWSFPAPREEMTIRLALRLSSRS